MPCIARAQLLGMHDPSQRMTRVEATLAKYRSSTTVCAGGKSVAWVNGDGMANGVHRWTSITTTGQAAKLLDWARRDPRAQYRRFKISSSRHNRKGRSVVNIFGWIVRCDMIAEAAYEQ